VTAVARRLEAALGEETHMADVALVRLQEQIAGPVRRPLSIMLAAVGCLILIASANLGNLLVVLASGRRRELAVRAALGAGRLALARPVLAETMLLSAAGGLLGLALGAAGLRIVIALEPGNLPRLAEIGVSLPVLLVSLAVTGTVALLLGAAVSYGAVRSGISESLKDGGRGQAGSASMSRLRNGLVVAQLAVSVVLLVTARLLGRSLTLLLQRAVADRRLGVLVLGGFAAVALVLAVVGIYGVLSYVVAQRTQEFGVRMALGARRADVWRLVVRQAGLLVVTGVVIGVVISGFVTSLMQAMLVGVTPTDPLTFAAVVAVLAVTALAACQVPALRATRADPLSALRAE